MVVTPAVAIAPALAICVIVLKEGQTMNETHMTDEQLRREMDYRVALSIAKKLHRQGLVSHGELRKIEQKLREIFSPVWGAINR